MALGRLIQYHAPPPAAATSTSRKIHLPQARRPVSSGSRSMRNADKSSTAKNESSLCVEDEYIGPTVRMAVANGSNQRLGGGLSSFNRPDCWAARRKRNSICALRLRRASFAQRWMASSTSGSMRRRNGFRSATTDLLVNRAGVDHRLRVAIAAQHHQQVADHCRLPLFVELDDRLRRQHVERHFHHADRAFHNALARRDDGAGLLALQHGRRDLGGVCQVADRKSVV